MLFTTNHDEAKDAFAPIKPGTYEAFISAAEATKAKSSGADMVKLTLTIRTDVEQEFQKRKLFENIVFSDKAMFKAQQVAKAVEIPHGTPIATTADFVQAVIFKPVQIRVTNREEEYQGETKIRENVVFYDVASKPMSGSQTNDPFAGAGNAPVDISEDDLPF